MYRYVECSKYEGKTVRTGGVTRRSLKALKHLPKIGTPTLCRGYTYFGTHETTHIGVVVRGTNGSLRFGGFAWGYYGEGCRGLEQLFKALNIQVSPFTDLGQWPNYNDVREHWRIALPSGEVTVHPKPSQDAQNVA